MTIYRFLILCKLEKVESIDPPHLKPHDGGRRSMLAKQIKFKIEVFMYLYIYIYSIYINLKKKPRQVDRKLLRHY